MAYSVTTATQDLSANSMTATTAFAKDFDLAMITITVDVATDSGLDTQNPTISGIQEAVQVWKKHPSDAKYNTLIHAGSFNGRGFFVFTPVGTWSFASGYEIILLVSNAQKVGTIYATITVK